MKKLIIILFLMFAFSVTIAAQSCDLLYFCTRYDATEGEISAGDRFFTGDLTVVTLLEAPIFYTKIYVQLDKYNPREGDFEYYNDYEFDVDPDLDYIYFDNINFGEAGFYRVFLLDPNRNTITSAIVEIINE
ncbi:MAG: hypothetical protein K9N09_05675 [Candidatus Cloacimonetes bacterium]|nr:hypothetical protein [Candidatus Cloacimonadota bacterium]MCF7814705.1 hypothetical protein [Candidatus Cloacimonadota bacterium]MCF7868174.1 hypothetical protein [Candidatus Cloacimonadota bacterium]MCF7884474.1 hypothetical protein [Candidatus Cloacimonadota bacterium]